MSKDYLDKYRDKPKSSSKSKKIKTKTYQGVGLKIVDADEGFAPISAPSFSIKKNPKRVLQHEDDEINPLDPDEMPQVVSMIDERPADIRLLEEFRQANKWKAVAADNDKKSGSVSRASKTVDSDSDPSPPRRIRHGSDSDYSPPRQRARASPPTKLRGGSDSDFSSRRKRDKGSPKKRDRRDEDISPPRKRKNQESPPRSRKDNDGAMYPVRGKARGSDSDASPPRRRDDRESEKRSRRNRSPRNVHRQRNRSESDASPPRQNRSRGPEQVKGSSTRRGSDSDHSPVRRRQGSPQNNRHFSGRRRSRSPEPPQRLTKTLDGKKAGLQSAGALREELNTFKQHEKERFAKMDDSVSGRYAKTKFRDRETGKLRDMEAELEQKREEDKKAAERKAQYDKWGKGIKQAEEQQERVDSAMHEMAKPLARYKDDEDLDAHLKSLDREGDPMLKFLAKKKAKASGSGPSKPVYQGPAPPPNRFKILPGYRWDGVDRSSGYEKEWFQKINSKKALQEESYKWSVEDL